MIGRLLGGEIAARAGFEERLQFALGVMRGIALLDGFHPDPAARARQWKFARAQLVALFTDEGTLDDRYADTGGTASDRAT